MQAASSMRPASGDIGEWPLIAPMLLTAIATPLFLVESLDVLCNFAIHSGSSGLQGAVIDGSDYGLFAGFAAIAYWLSRRGIQGAYLSVLGVVVSMVVIFNFRGSFLRKGTFDLWEQPAFAWMRFIFLGCLIGGAVGLAMPRKDFRPGKTWTYLLLASLLVTLAVGSHILQAKYGTSSIWAPSRVYALTAIGLFLAILVGISHFWRED